MAGGYVPPPVGDFAVLRERLREVERRLAELERPTGTQTAQALKTLTDLVNGLLEQTDLAVTNNITAGGNATIHGTLTGVAGINSLGAYNLDVTTLAGPRRTAWWHSSGAAGYAPSTRTRKQNIQPAEFTPEQFMAIAPKVFEYRAQADIRDNPGNPQHDPNYVVPLEIGLIAEDLLDAGLGAFVFDDDEGRPAGIDYATFGAICSLVLGQAAYKAATA